MTDFDEQQLAAHLERELRERGIEVSVHAGPRVDDPEEGAMTEPEAVYDGRISERCAQGCLEGPGCETRGPYTSWCGGCCACRGGCRAGYYEWEEDHHAGEAPHADT